jgi:pimeloyl-ACP methyl ester carboxylesterase
MQSDIQAGRHPEMTVCLFPGMGLNAHYFAQLDFPWFCRVIHIELLEPYCEENILAYGTRLIRTVPTDLPVILVGMSFGGVVAQEVAELVSPEAVFILSSIESAGDLPWFIKGAYRHRHSRVIPFEIVSKVVIKGRKLFRKRYGHMYTEETLTPRFLSWSLNVIGAWRSPSITSYAVRIHGTGDRLLPCRNQAVHFPIHNAGHLIAAEKPGEVNNILHREIQTVMDRFKKKKAM